MFSRIISASGTTAILLLAACAATQPNIDAAHSGGQWLKTSLISGIAEPEIDTNGYQMSAAVRAGLIESFELQAKKTGLKVVSIGGVQVKITVQEYSTRSNVARFMFGALAGTDHIKATVDVGDASFEVEDSAHSTINGIETVAEDVGIEAANGVAQLAGLPVGN